MACISALGLSPVAARAEAPAVVSLLPPGEVTDLAHRATMEKGTAISSIEAVSTTSGAANSALNPHTVSSPATSAATPVVLMVMHGYFIDGLASVPPGASAPRGEVMAFVADDDSGAVAEIYVGNTSPDLQALGPVEMVPVPEGIPREADPQAATTGDGLLHVMVAGDGGRRIRRRARITVVVRRGPRLVYRGQLTNLRLAPARYQLSAEVRFSPDGRTVRCRKHSVTVRPGASTSVTLRC